MTNYNDGEWHIWSGGECPVNPKSRGDVVWLHTLGPANVIEDEVLGTITFGGNDYGKVAAFRVTKECRDPREWWLFKNGHGDMCASGTWRGHGAIHVREVLEGEEMK